ncbi:hypothetical protein V8F06_014483 [Rhypophila decipiens]
MDWINHEGGFKEHDFTTFEYDDGDCGVAKEHDRAGAQLITWMLDAEYPIRGPLEESHFTTNDRKDGLDSTLDKEGQQSWETAIALRHGGPDEPQPSLSRCSTLGNEVAGVLPDKTTRPGFHLILLPRMPDVFPGQASSVSELPFSEYVWRAITKEFRVHRTITRTTLREVAYFSSLRHTPKDLGVLEISYTARMAAAIPNDLALSTSYIPSQNTTYSILYGCNECQVKEIWNRITTISMSSQHSHMHPLLTMGIFIELERTRLVNKADKLADEFTLGSDILEHSDSANLNSPKMESYLKICLRSRTLADYIRAVKRQLIKVLAELDELERFWKGSIDALMAKPKTPRTKTYTNGKLERDEEEEKVQQEQQKQKELFEGLIGTGQQMKQRIKDIMDEYDDKIDECKKMGQNLSLAMQTGWNQIAQQDSITSTRISHINTEIAWEAKREGAQMRSIAVLGMIYLPLSCVASVFSTSLFNWNPSEGESVVSSYIWILAVLAAGMTILTVLAWHLWTRREKKHEEAKKKSELGLGKNGLNDAEMV